jgi:predicted O-methyltransferase YrrM
MFNDDWYSNYQLDNLEALAKQVKNKEGAIIEIGCWEGKSTVALAKSFYPEVLVCNDTWLGNIQESIITGTTHATELILKERDVYTIFQENMSLLTDGNYTIVKRDCIEWLKEYNEPIKFIHIDASHDYESVHETIRLVLPNMIKGGILCGDDFLSANMHVQELHGGVERAVRELLPNFKNVGNLWYCFT